ncbi:universal stress protein [Methanobacterium alcaliphilum]|uniref:universal stress protein n=1 Tax=Methanobacterium alcaliphilum TaxID=392018 RepID=UPI00200AAF67|nr:universal stress protein [Methanobacterium alcaliphilum]MCK9152520.1 universal stress protein [Methanobacterium alcaliphilum]
MFKKILLPVMGEYLDELVEHTLELAQGKQIEVIGLYVVETSVPFLTPANVKKMMKEELSQKGEEILNSLAAKFHTPSTYMINFQKVMLEGNPADTIVELAAKEEVDIIVMGTGKSIVDKHLLGSVSEKVVHSTPCSIMLVKTVN